MEYMFVETDKIKEDLCVKFFRLLEKLQDEQYEKYKIRKASYKLIMRTMPIGRDRLQKLLNCIGKNWLYFKIQYGWMLNVSNIVMSVDWSQRPYYKGQPAYHLWVENYYTKNN